LHCDDIDIALVYLADSGKIVAATFEFGDKSFLFKAMRHMRSKYAATKIRDGKGKNGGEENIPTMPRTREILWQSRSMSDRHETLVFTFIAKRSNYKLKYVKGGRYPMTATGFKDAFSAAVKKHSLTNFHFHDTRTPTAEFATMNSWRQ